MFKFANVTVRESYIESLFLKVVHLNKETVVGSIYHPPYTGFHSFISFFFNLPWVIYISSDMIICGDSNFGLLKINLFNDIAYFYNRMSSISLIPVITRSTRKGGTCFVSNYGNVKSGILTIDITEHLLILIVYGSYFQSSYVSPHSIKFWVINGNTLTNFYSSFESVNFPEILQDSNVNRSLETLDANISDCCNQCCPIKTKIISIKPQLKPSITR